MTPKILWLRLLNLVMVLALLLLYTSVPKMTEAQSNRNRANSISAQGQTWTVQQQTPTPEIEDVEFVGHLEGVANDVFLVDHYAYIAAGSEGLRVVDVSVPSNPKELGSYDTPGNASHAVVSGNYAYVADGEGGVRIIDISAPTNPREVSFYETPGTTSNVAVAEGYAYIADYSYSSYTYGLQILDVSDPTNPRKLGYHKMPGEVRAVVVVGDYAYVANYDWGVWIVDVSNPHNLVNVERFSIGGWAVDIAVSGNYAYVAARENNLQVVDVSNPYSLREVGDVLNFATGVVVDQGLAYVVNGGYIPPRTELRVVDVTTPSNPKEVGFYDTPGSAIGVATAEDYVYVADGTGGLLVLRYTGEEDRVEPLVGTPIPTVVLMPKTEPTPSMATLIPFELRDSKEWIAFIGLDRNVWLVHPDGSELQQITTDAGVTYNAGGVEQVHIEYSDPKWSPAGDRLAFVRYDHDDREYSLMVFDIDASELTILTSDIAGGFDWSPDGERIIYDRPCEIEYLEPGARWVNYGGLWIFDLSSGEARHFISPTLDMPLTNPNWSPDGSQVGYENIFPCWDVACFVAFSVIKVGEDTPYTRYEGFQSGLTCDWSPDGIWLICADPPENEFLGPCPLLKFDRNGQLIDEFPVDQLICDLNPLWSPDGRYIAIESLIGGWVEDEFIPQRSFVEIVSDDGTERRHIGDGVPVGWSPDGQWLLTINEEDLISAVEIETGAIISIGEGSNADWQPYSEHQAVPLIARAPLRLAGIVGEEMSVEVHVQNDGDAALTGATLTISTSGAILSTHDVPPIDAGQSTKLTLPFTPSSKGESMLVLELTAGTYTDSRTIPLEIEARPETPTSQPALLVEEPVSSPPEEASAQRLSPLLIAIPTIGLIVVVLAAAGVLGVIGLRLQVSAHFIWIGAVAVALVIGLILVAAVTVWQIGQRQKWSWAGSSPSTPRVSTTSAPTAYLTPTVLPPTVTPSPSPTFTPFPTDTPWPTDTPTPTRLASCPGAPPQQVQVGARAEVCTAYDRLTVRAQPQRSSAEVTRLEPGAQVTVVDGPVCADNWSWWKVRTDLGAVGWVAEGGDEVDPYFICPVR